jgi:hypothetical protein
MVNIKRMVFAVCGSLSLLTVAVATPILDTPETWTAAGLNGWTVTAPALGDNPLAGGNPGGYLQVELTDQGGPYSAQAYTTGGGFAGNENYTLNGLTVHFDFRYETEEPNSVSVYFYSGTSGREWVSTALGSYPAEDSWAHYAQNFQWGSWSLIGGGGTYAQFAADLLDVDRVGFSVTGDWTIPGSQYLGFDNFEFRIPEPESIFMISLVLLLTGFSFRSRWADLFQRARVLIGKK